MRAVPTDRVWFAGRRQPAKRGRRAPCSTCNHLRRMGRGDIDPGTRRTVGNTGTCSADWMLRKSYIGPSSSTYYSHTYKRLSTFLHRWRSQQTCAAGVRRTHCTLVRVASRNGHMATLKTLNWLTGQHAETRPRCLVPDQTTPWSEMDRADSKIEATRGLGGLY